MKQQLRRGRHIRRDAQGSAWEEEAERLKPCHCCLVLMAGNRYCGDNTLHAMISNDCLVIVWSDSMGEPPAYRISPDLKVIVVNKYPQ